MLYTPLLDSHPLAVPFIVIRWFKMSQRTILVLGATGKQGKALIRSLLHPASPSPSSQKYHILALTRTISSPAAQALRESEEEDELTVVEGNLDNEDGMRKVFEDAKCSGNGIWGVFAVLAFPGLGAEADGEERQGKVCCFPVVKVGG